MPVPFVDMSPHRNSDDGSDADALVGDQTRGRLSRQPDARQLLSVLSVPELAQAQNSADPLRLAAGSSRSCLRRGGPDGQALTTAQMSARRTQITPRL